MTAKAENRWNKVNRNWADIKLEESKMGRAFDRLVYNANKLEEKYNDQKTEIERLNSELDKARLEYQQQSAELESLKMENAELRLRIDSEKQEKLRWFAALESKKKAHNKLSAIVRLALTPEEYHTWRQSAAEIYPNLFNS